MATHSSILAWRIPWTEEPNGHRAAQSQMWLKQLSKLTQRWTAHAIGKCQFVVDRVSVGLQRRNVPGISDEGELKVGEPEAISEAWASCKHRINLAVLTVTVVDGVFAQAPLFSIYAFSRAGTQVCLCPQSPAWTSAHIITEFWPQTLCELSVLLRWILILPRLQSCILWGFCSTKTLRFYKEECVSDELGRERCETVSILPTLALRSVLAGRTG